MSFFNLITTLHLNIFIVFTFLFISPASSEENSLDNLIFYSCETQGNISSKLTKGYRAFIVLPDSPIEEILNDAERFLTKDKKSLITLIFKQEAFELNNQLQQHNVKNVLATPGLNDWKDLASCRKAGKRLFIFAPGQSSFYYPIESNFCSYSVPQDFPTEYKNGFSGNQANDFVIFKMDSIIDSLPDSLRLEPYLVPELFNSYTGKLPNFFVTERMRIYLHFKGFIEHYKWYTANVIHNDKPLPGISWQGVPNLESYGKVHIRRERISPKKNGYRFSPDVFQFNKLTSQDTKIFYANPKNLSSEQVLSLNFDKNIKNLVLESSEIPFSNLEYIKDPSRGWCGFFNGKDHYIDFDTDIKLEDHITISVWVNPTRIKENHSILGKGTAYTVKFKDGKLLFTTTGIKDHYSDSIVVRKNEWQQLAFVFSAGNNVRFFRNGKLIGEKKATKIIPTNHSLLIGTNLWDEYFEGMMDDLSIWNRALSDEEIAKAYKQSLNADSHISTTLFILTFIIILIVVFIFIRKKTVSKDKKVDNPQQIQPKSIIQAPLPIQEKRLTKGPAIEIFGGFNIVNRDGENLTSRFSTRRKQLFILVLIATFKDNGINSKQLTNKLWEGYSTESAKNNRSTQIQRLREIFSQNTGISIDYKDKRWCISLHEDIFCDIQRYFSVINQIKKADNKSFSSELLLQLLEIIEKGAVLPQMEDEWLDEFKSKISDELLDLLLPIYHKQELMKNHRLAVRLSDALFIFDPLNETVLKHKVNQLFQLGKKTLAHECLDHFSKYYQQCYDQPFEMSLTDLLDKKV